MALPAFDTYAYVKKLQDAGFSEQEAAAQVEFQSDVLSSLVTEKLATKDDIKDLKNEIEIKFTKIDGKFNLITWMIGLNSAGLVYLIGKLVWFHT